MITGTIVAGVLTMLGGLFGGSITELTKHRLANPKPEKTDAQKFKFYAWLLFIFSAISFIILGIIFNPAEKLHIIALILEAMYVVLGVFYIWEAIRMETIDLIIELATQNADGQKMLVDNVEGLAGSVEGLTEMAIKQQNRTAQSDVQKNKARKGKDSTDTMKS